MLRGCTAGLNDIPVPDEARIGGKGANLVRMARAGLPVPDGFCVSADAYRAHLRAHGIDEHIYRVLADLAAAGAASEICQSALADIRLRIIDAPLAPDLEGEMTRSYRALGAARVAVRSSATAEDLPGHSFAGQHGTYFCTTLESTLLHVKHCWASLWTQHAFEYRKAHGFRHPDVEMAVVVQRLVEADVSGVLFTADPLHGRRDRLTIEACWGLGEALVSGKVTPDRFVINRDTLTVVECRVAEKKVEVALAPDGAKRERAVDAARSARPCIDDVIAKQVAELGITLEHIFDGPQDVEWAIHDGRICVLQARPITALPPLDRTVWSNANAGEVLPGVVCPMTWSLVRPLVGAIFETIFGKLGLDLSNVNLIDRIAGRVYFNVTVLAGAVRALPTLGNMDVDQLLGGMQGRDSERERLTITDEDLPDLRLGLAHMLIRIPSFTLWWMAHSPVRSQGLIDEIRRRTEAVLTPDLPTSSEKDVAAKLATLSKGIYRLPDAIGFALVGFMHYSNLSAISDRWLGDQDGSLTHRLLAGLGGMASADAGLALWRLAVSAHDCRDVRETVLAGACFDEVRTRVRRVAGGRAFLDSWDAFMRDHGHHTRGELDVLNARWSDRPDYVLSVIRSYLADFAKTDPLASYKQRAAERETLTRECRHRLRSPVKRAIFAYVLRRAQLGSVSRENVKSEGVRYLAAMRALLLTLGQRLADRDVLTNADDIFYLYLDEVTPARRGAASFDVKEMVAARRAEYEQDLLLDPPPVIVGRFNPSSVTHHNVPASRVLHGLPVSAGVATGHARVILRADMDQRILPGEILVAPFTDPGWTPYFMPAAGIVMDMGGALSHGSIVAREYGIPAVVNVGPATTVIKTGQTVRVDGTRGEVTVLD